MKYSMLSGTMLMRAGLLAAATMFAGACATTRAPDIETAGSPLPEVQATAADADEVYVVRSMFFKDRGLHVM